MDNTNIVPIESQAEILNQLFQKLFNEAKTPKRTKREKDEDKPNAVTQIVNIAKQNCTFFVDDEQRAYAKIRRGKGKECMRIDRKPFSSYLKHLYHKTTNLIATEKSIISAKELLIGLAEQEGEIHKVFMRVAKHEDKYYIDIGDNTFRVIEVSKLGWKITDDSPVYFVRTRYFKALPIPDENGDIDKFWNLVNIEEKYRGLLIAWMLECFRPDTEYPILELFGGQDSGKSKTQYFIRQLIDPRTRGLLKTPPQNVKDDIYIACANTHLLSLNNCTTFSREMQKALCCVADGGDYEYRKFYTEAETEIVSVMRPCMWSGITNCATESDLVDRLISLPLLSLKGTGKKKNAAELDEYFNENSSGIFGGLLNVFVKALNELDNINFDECPPSVKIPDIRFMGFARFGQAVYRAMGIAPDDCDWSFQFIQDYQSLKIGSISQSLHNNPVYLVIMTYLIKKYLNCVPKKFTESGDQILEEYGTVGSIYHKLREFINDSQNGPNIFDKTVFPKTPYGFGKELIRIKENATLLGLEINKDNVKRHGTYKLHLKYIVPKDDIDKIEWDFGVPDDFKKPLEQSMR